MKLIALALLSALMISVPVVAGAAPAVQQKNLVQNEARTDESVSNDSKIHHDTIKNTVSNVR